MSQPQADPMMQQIGMLNLRINDMMTQLNVVMKTMIEENAALKKENTELKAKKEN
jgi:regulator of replication initiation timing